MKSKKGSIVSDLMIFIVIAVVIVVFLGVWKYGINALTSPLLSVPDSNGISVANATRDTLGLYNTALDKLHLLSFIIIAGMMLTILGSAFLTRGHPVFYIVAIFSTIMSVIFSVYVSNIYENLLSNSVIGSTLQGFTASNYILLNLPIIVGVLGVFSAIFMFIGTIQPRGVSGDIS